MTKELSQIEKSIEDEQSDWKKDLQQSMGSLNGCLGVAKKKEKIGTQSMKSLCEELELLGMGKEGRNWMERCEDDGEDGNWEEGVYGGEGEREVRRDYQQEERGGSRFSQLNFISNYEEEKQQQSSSFEIQNYSNSPNYLVEVVSDESECRNKQNLLVGNYRREDTGVGNGNMNQYCETAESQYHQKEDKVVRVQRYMNGWGNSPKKVEREYGVENNDDNNCNIGNNNKLKTNIKLPNINYKDLFLRQIKKNEKLRNFLIQVRNENIKLKQYVSNCKRKKSRNKSKERNYKEFSCQVMNKKQGGKKLGKTPNKSTNKINSVIFQISKQIKTLGCELKKLNINMLKFKFSTKCEKNSQKQVGKVRKAKTENK